MIAYYFRVLDDATGAPTGYTGMVVGYDKRDVFWLIDEFVDPYAVEIKTAARGGYCYLQKNPDGLIDPCDGGPSYLEDAAEDRSEFEFSEYGPMSNDLGWKKPNWSEDYRRPEREAK